jgi:exocyst complex component 4
MSHLIDHMFVSSARSLKVINAAGVAKIQRNMLALQQTMRSINQSPADGVLHLSSVYWDMYNQDPKVSYPGNVKLTGRISWRT